MGDPLTARSLRAALAAFASSDPTPGGGSASALAAALGAALLLMVARLPRTRSNASAERAALEHAATALTTTAERLTAAIDDDSAAYDRVSAAYRRPATGDAEKAARKAAIQAALRGATEVPLGVMQLSVEALEQAAAVAANGHRAAASDAGVAVKLLLAGLEGAWLNVQVNLDGLADASFVAAASGKSGRLATLGRELAGEAETLLR